MKPKFIQIAATAAFEGERDVWPQSVFALDSDGQIWETHYSRERGDFGEWSKMRPHPGAEEELVEADSPFRSTLEKELAKSTIVSWSVLYSILGITTPDPMQMKGISSAMKSLGWVPRLLGWHGEWVKL